MPRDGVEIGDEPSGVPTGRRFVSERLRQWNLDRLAPDAELAATELLTNALLHAGPPVRLVVEVGAGVVRIEVHDPSTVLPVRPRADPGAMTGRGLQLVDAIASRWGAERSAAGKVIWAELTEESTTLLEPADIDVDALLAAFDDLDDDDPSTRRYTVTLGDVPTDLLLAAKAHVDSLAREFSLVAGGAASGMTAQLPAHVSELVNAVVSEFAEARQSIKRQAIAAAGRGDERTTLTLTLPATAADAGERYLAALDMADSYARAARMLTLEASPQHQAFRHWYVRSLVTTLRHAAKGAEPPRPVTFEAFLLGEIDHLAELQRISLRGARLQRVTAALAAVMTADDVGVAVLDAAVTALAASRGSILRPADDGLTLFASAGHGGPAGRRGAELGTATAVGAEAYTSGEPVWVESREDRDGRYPAMATEEPDVVAACAVPLTSGRHRLGVLTVGFHEPRLFDDEEKAFLVALAAAAAQALERAVLYDEQRMLADRLARLQEVTAAFSRTRGIADVARVVVDNATDALGADVGTLCVLEDDGETLRVVATRSVLPEYVSQFRTFPTSAELPAAEAVRTGEIVTSRSIRDRDARWPTLAGLPPEYEHTLVCLPLRVEESPLGALTLSFAGSTRVGDAETRWLAAMADACAQALARARSVERLEQANAELGLANTRLAEANDKLAFLAAASTELGSSLDYERTLAAVARLAVPRLADWMVVSVVEDGGLRNLTVAHVDPAKVAMAQEAQERWPVTLDAPTGVPAVIRSGLSEVHPVITDEMLASGALDEEHLRMLRDAGMSSVLIVPLTAGERTFGALTLITAESGRHYGADDLPFAEDLASRAALAIDNARRFRQVVSAELPPQVDGDARPTGRRSSGPGSGEGPAPGPDQFLAR